MARCNPRSLNASACWRIACADPAKQSTLATRNHSKASKAQIPKKSCCLSSNSTSNNTSQFLSPLTNSSTFASQSRKSKPTAKSPTISKSRNPIPLNLRKKSHLLPFPKKRSATHNPLPPKLQSHHSASETSSSVPSAVRSSNLR